MARIAPTETLWLYFQVIWRVISNSVPVTPSVFQPSTKNCACSSQDFKLIW